MAVAVKAALKNRNGMWFGWSGKVAEEPTASLRSSSINKMTYVLIDLSQNDIQEYYNGLANSVLWPILHYRVDLQNYSRADASGYMRVNRMFADRLSALLEEDDVIWVHDYHLMLLAKRIARARPSQPDRLFSSHPLRAARHSDRPCRTIRRSWAASPITTWSDSRRKMIATISPITRDPRRQPDRTATTFDARWQESARRRVPGQHRDQGVHAPRAQRGRARTWSAGAREPWRQQAHPRRRPARLFQGHPDRIKAFDRLLEMNPEWRGNVTFLQVTPKSRSDIKQYAAIEDEVTASSARINGQYGEAAWTPIRYVNRSYSRTVLAGLYRAANVAMVTPLRDGMNSSPRNISRRRILTIPACWCCRNSPAPPRSSIGR